MELDVLIIGGGAAGLSAAVALGRSRRSVTVLDAGSPRNAPAEGVHNFLTRDGTPPSELLAIGRKEVEQYGGVIVSGEARHAQRIPGGFAVTADDGRVFTARRLLVTTGLTDELPDLPGVREGWGHTVLHCPYCHGWEVRDQAIGILATSPFAVHQALLFRQLSDDVVLFQHTAPALPAEQEAQLRARGIRIETSPVASVSPSGVRLEDGSFVARQAIVVAPKFVANTRILEELGLPAQQHPNGFGMHVPAKPTGATDVPGVYVAGNVTDLAAQVVVAAGQGLMAGAAINAELCEEEAHDALMFSAGFWDDRYGSTARVWSGNPNVQLVASVSELSPGTALDVGSGEGADAIWLALRGWQVTAVDISQIALDRAAAEAARAGVDGIRWQAGDLLTWDPAPEQYDLVSAQFIHLPGEARAALHQRLAAAVRPGGMLLIVGHHPSIHQTTFGGAHRHHRPELFYTAEEVAATLDPAQWRIEVSTVDRPAKDPDGQPIVIQDAVLVATRAS
jgi:thioredoxin reductase/SAM-dependent methyltransferase